MNRWKRLSAVTACCALTLACDEQSEVQRQTRDLQEAQKNVGKVTQELESELGRAHADVERLEQKLALARQGLTDDVLENQKELQAALKAQERKVESEIGEAKREAQIHQRDTKAALEQLGQPAPVTAEAPLDSPEHPDLVPVKGGPDPHAEGSVEIERGTPEPTTPPVVVTPNDPPAPTPAPAVLDGVTPGSTPSAEVPPSDPHASAPAPSSGTPGASPASPTPPNAPAPAAPP